eukprot:XP_001693796.1 predicted protein [Chlamydomonas reinhardtii]
MTSYIGKAQLFSSLLCQAVMAFRSVKLELAASVARQLLSTAPSGSVLTTNANAGQAAHQHGSAAAQTVPVQVLVHYHRAVLDWACIRVAAAAVAAAATAGSGTCGGLGDLVVELLGELRSCLARLLGQGLGLGPGHEVHGLGEQQQQQPALLQPSLEQCTALLTALLECRSALTAEPAAAAVAAGNPGKGAGTVHGFQPRGSSAQLRAAWWAGLCAAALRAAHACVATHPAPKKVWQAFVPGLLLPLLRLAAPEGRGAALRLASRAAEVLLAAVLFNDAHVGPLAEVAGAYRPTADVSGEQRAALAALTHSLLGEGDHAAPGGRRLYDGILWSVRLDLTTASAVGGALRRLLSVAAPPLDIAAAMAVAGGSSGSAATAGTKRVPGGYLAAAILAAAQADAAGSAAARTGAAATTAVAAAVPVTQDAAEAAEEQRLLDALRSDLQPQLLPRKAGAALTRQGAAFGLEAAAAAAGPGKGAAASTAAPELLVRQQQRLLALTAATSRRGGSGRVAGSGLWSVLLVDAGDEAPEGRSRRLLLEAFRWPSLGS